MTKTQNPFIAAEWIRRAVNQDYIEDNLVEYDWFLAQDEALAARILELGKQRGSAFALYRQGADAMQKGNTDEAIAALVALGYKPTDAEKMVKKVAKADLSSEQLIREALKAAL